MGCERTVQQDGLQRETVPEGIVIANDLAEFSAGMAIMGRALLALRHRSVLASVPHGGRLSKTCCFYYLSITQHYSSGLKASLLPSTLTRGGGGVLGG